MFSGCKNLNYVKALFTTNPTSDKYEVTDWLSGVSSTGVFVKNAQATWNRYSVGIPSKWSVIDE